MPAWWSWRRAPETGGSSAVSAGIVWTARDLAGWLSVQPGGDPTLGKAQVTTFPEAVEWLQAQQVRAVPFEFGATGWNPPIPLPGLPTSSLATTAVPTHAPPWIDSPPTSPTRAAKSLPKRPFATFQQDSSGRVVGAEARGPGGRLRITASAAIMATGGFPGQPRASRPLLRSPTATAMILRANPYSTGEAFQAALSVGAGTAGPFSRFYGHRVVAPPAQVDFPLFPRVHLGGALPGAILVNLRGERYVDDSLSDEVSVHAIPPPARGTGIHDLQRSRCRHRGRLSRAGNRQVRWD